jgi:hypothetical protein
MPFLFIHPPEKAINVIPTGTNVTKMFALINPIDTFTF